MRETMGRMMNQDLTRRKLALSSISGVAAGAALLTESASAQIRMPDDHPTKSRYFLIRIQPARKNFYVSMTPSDQQTMNAHYRYLQSLLLKGQLVLTGPVRDPNNPFEILIVETVSKQHALDIMQNDPSVKSGTQTAELFPFQLALTRENATQMLPVG